MHRVFRLDFTPWSELGFAFPEYTPFTFFVDGEAVANVSASPMELTLDGRPRTGIQLGTVCCAPEYRGRGLVRELTERAHRHWEGKADFQFLFANESVLEFYPRFGYRAVAQHRFTAAAPTGTEGGGPPRRRRLEEGEDREFLCRLAEERTPVSLRCGVRRHAWLWLWYATLRYPDRLQWIEELGVVVISYRKDEVLHVVDVMGPRMPSFAQLLPHLEAAGSARLEFHFVPDRLVGLDAMATPDPDAHLFVRGDFPTLGEPFRFPETGEA